MVTLSIEAKLTMCKRYRYNLIVFVANEGIIPSGEVINVCSLQENTYHHPHVNVIKGSKISYIITVVTNLQFIVTYLSDSESGQLRQPTKESECLKDSEVFSGSHQYAFLVGTDCCRRAEPPHFCQEHKSLFQAMIQRNHLALPILSSPCYPHHSTK